MAILELSILFDGKNIYEHKFYSSISSVKIDDSVRDNLMQAVVGLSEQAFNDQVKKFCIAEYAIMMKTDTISVPGEDDHEIPIRMYIIAENETTNEKKVLSLMETAMFQFLNRFSFFDIMNKDTTKFVEFSDRFNKIFKDVIEDSYISDDLIKNNKSLKMMENRLGDLRTQALDLH